MSSQPFPVWHACAVDLAQLERLAGGLAAAAREEPLHCALEGPLGAGKTTLTQATARALAVQEVLSSPTYGLLAAYRGDITMVHGDFYRLSHADDLDELDLDGLRDEADLLMIEWASKVSSVVRRYVNGRGHWRDPGELVRAEPAALAERWDLLLALAPHTETTRELRIAALSLRGVRCLQGLGAQ